MSTIDTLCY